jgi:hypothetical protein
VTDGLQRSSNLMGVSSKESFTLKDFDSKTITTAAMLSVIDQTWRRLMVVLDRCELSLDAGPVDGGWTPRQMLSHIVGSWQRVPVHTAFFLTGRATVPLVFGDAFWIPEWETAPIEAFKYALQVAYEGSRAFVRQLTPDDLACMCKTPLGEMSLGEFLMTCYVFHISDMHITQMDTVLQKSGSGERRRGGM